MKTCYDRWGLFSEQSLKRWDAETLSRTLLICHLQIFCVMLH
jgi:hypothetical protein